MKIKVLVTHSCLTLSWTVAHQAPRSMEFSRQEYWSGYPFPFLRDLPKPGINPVSPALQAESLLSEPPRNPCLWYTRYYPLNFAVNLKLL